MAQTLMSSMGLVVIGLFLSFCFLGAHAAENDSDISTLSCPSTFVEALRAGKWDCAKEISETAMQASSGSGGQDLRNLFDLESRLISKELADLKKHLESNIILADISPAYQWAQSTEEIFLSVKFAHKLDTPGTLNVEAKNVTLLENRLELHASDGRKNFRLEMNFLKGVVPEESSWSMASVGRMSFTLRKKQPVGVPSKWSRLLKETKRVSNQHFWLAMHEKYAKELDKVPEEDEDANEEWEEQGEKKIKKQKHKTAAEKSTTSSASVAPTDTTINAVPEHQHHPALAARLEELMATYKAEVARLESEAKAKKKEADAACRQRKQTLNKERDDAIRLLNETLAQDQLYAEGNFTAVLSDIVGETQNV